MNGRATSWAILALTALVACSDPEARARKELAGEYVRDLDGGEEAQWSVRQVLTLRPDGNWTRTTHMVTGKTEQDMPPDSGTYRITGVTVNLRSLVSPGVVPIRFTISGDTLYGANAAQAHAMTGVDIGEEVFVRAH